MMCLCVSLHVCNYVCGHICTHIQLDFYFRMCMFMYVCQQVSGLGSGRRFVCLCVYLFMYVTM